jgi:hypothetical protein
MPLNLQVIVAEDFLVPRSYSDKLVVSSIEDQSGQFPVGTPREGDKPIMVELEKLFIYPGLIVESLKVALSNQLEQIAIALLVLGQ